MIDSLPGDYSVAHHVMLRVVPSVLGWEQATWRARVSVYWLLAVNVFRHLPGALRLWWSHRRCCADCHLLKVGINDRVWTIG